MKKIFLLVSVLVLVATLSACGEDGLCVGPECLGAVGTDDTADEYVAGQGYLVPFTHLNGEGHESTNNAIILMEWPNTGDSVIYQVTYLSCTCRSADINFWNTVYLRIGKADGVINEISFDEIETIDGHHYYAGNWGDSSGNENQNFVTYEMFEADFFPWFIGKSLAELDGMSVWTNGTLYGDFSNSGGTQIDQTLVDEFAGSSVSTNNFLRVVIEMLHYHEDKYLS